ncbi:MAG: hypothetical protein KJO98_13115 [Rhodothermia bacterium]|nr:hypothetical protein [Rhodothermia bacterium]
MSGQVRVDVVVSSPSDRIGVICDQADSRKIHRQRSLLNDLFVDRVYLTSQLDAMIDPLAVARGIARREPDLFAMPGESRDASALGSRVGVVRSLRTAPNQPPLRLDRPLEREWPGEATRPVQAA